MQEPEDYVAAADTYYSRRQRWLGDSASFASMFSEPGFQFASWRLTLTYGRGMVAECHLSQEARKFFDYCGRTSDWLPPFDWLDWLGSIEAVEFYKEPNLIAQATPEQLARLLIAHTRNDRVNPGALYAAFQSGILTAIVQRAQALVEG